MRTRWRAARSKRPCRSC